MDGVKTGLLGGTFDPIHLGHLVLAECAREQFELDEVRFLIAGDPWRKWGKPVSPAIYRIAMVQLGIANNRRFVLDTSEIERAGPTYTIETLRELHGQMKASDQLYFLLGEDALADMVHWREPDTIAALAQLAVAPRTREANASDEKFPKLPTLTVEMPAISISSTELRERVREGKSIRYQVPAAVEAYIFEHHLYRD